jgi:membrane-associated protease RseP (regulator of RpoE activity)
MLRRPHWLPLAALAALLFPLTASLAAQEAAPKPDGPTRYEFRSRVPAPDGEGGWQVERGQLRRIPFGPRGYLGVQLIDITPELRRHYGAPEEHGVLIGQVAPDSPAAQAGLQVGDILTRLDGEMVNGAMDVTGSIAPKAEGETVSITVWRDGSALDFSATLAQREAAGLHQMPGLPRVHFVPRGEFQFRGEDGEVVELKDLPNLQWFDAEKFGEVFKSPEWQGALERLQADRGPLLQRIDELEKRLEEMEALLKKLDRK